jgi:hypothetical protein
LFFQCSVDPETYRIKSIENLVIINESLKSNIQLEIEFHSQTGIIYSIIDFSFKNYLVEQLYSDSINEFMNLQRGHSISFNLSSVHVSDDSKTDSFMDKEF